MPVIPRNRLSYVLPSACPTECQARHPMSYRVVVMARCIQHAAGPLQLKGASSK
jgi:hypothetical protein